MPAVSSSNDSNTMTVMASNYSIGVGLSLVTNQWYGGSHVSQNGSQPAVQPSGGFPLTTVATTTRSADNSANKRTTNALTAGWLI
jgi:hypothetical protein